MLRAVFFPLMTKNWKQPRGSFSGYIKIMEYYSTIRKKRAVNADNNLDEPQKN